MADLTLSPALDTFFATPSSANLAAAVTDETGTGALVFATSPTFVTPTLGVAVGTTLCLQPSANTSSTLIVKNAAGTTRAIVGGYNNADTYGAIYFGAGAVSPGTTNYTLLSNYSTGTTYFNSILEVQTCLSDVAYIKVNSTGIKLAQTTSQKIGFWNVTPVVQPSHIADPTGGAIIDAEARTAINAILAWQATLGLTAAS